MGIHTLDRPDEQQLRVLGPVVIPEPDGHPDLQRGRGSVVGHGIAAERGRAAMERILPGFNRSAGIWARGSAFALDLTCVCFFAVMLTGVWSGSEFFVWCLAVPAYVVLGHGLFQRTLGKAAFDLQVVCADREGPIGLRRAAVRFAVQWLPVYLAYGLGAAIDNLVDGGRAQTVSDYIAGILGGAAIMRIAVEILWAAWRRPRRRVSWERLSGTLVRYRR